MRGVLNRVNTRSLSRRKSSSNAFAKNSAVCTSGSRFSSVDQLAFRPGANSNNSSLCWISVDERVIVPSLLGGGGWCLACVLHLDELEVELEVRSLDRGQLRSEERRV